MKIGIIILAGGKGERFHGKKQDLEFHGKTLWKHAYDTSVAAIGERNVVVVGRDVLAGSTRSESVMNGLAALEADTDKVVIVEAARPLVTVEQLNELITDKSKSASFVMPLVNTPIGKDGTHFDRNSFYDLLVPQSFDYNLLRKAYETGKYSDMTDETRVMYEEYGIKPNLIETGQNLFKVTYPGDIAVLESIYEMQKGEKDTKKVLITGGKGDIAKAIAEELLQAGYEVKAPGRLEMDVTNINDIERYIEAFQPDILINNAGYVVPQSVRNADFNCTKKHIDINIGGVFYCTQVALKYNKDLQIINIGSAAAIETHATWSEYCAAKAAVVMATRCWAEDGLYAVVISPGRTRTKMRRDLYPNEDQSTLLEPKDFAQIVMKAVREEYESGAHIVVRKQNVQQLLEEQSGG
ncbi:MAG: SDR family NAD(P)-dependent oxidoreductase [Lachnospiraceae bacterium]